MADDAQKRFPAFAANGALQPPAEAPLSKTAASLETAESRLELIQKLLTSQEPVAQVQRFFGFLAPLLPFTGLEYRAPGEVPPQLLGSPGRHQCDYRLNCEGNSLGHFIFSRDRRFSEADCEHLEQWLSILVLPLSNARRYQEALALALRDSLTGVGNRAALDSALHRELRLAERYGSEFSLLLVDVDHFKQVNDRFGHSLGDDILKQVAASIEDLCRASDLVFRYGGEEFVVLLSKTNHQGARVIAERIRQGVEEQVAVRDGEQTQVITVSIGIGTRRPEGEPSIHSLFDQADGALYRAKAQGRNRVIAGSLTDTSPATDSQTRPSRSRHQARGEHHG